MSPAYVFEFDLRRCALKQEAARSPASPDDEPPVSEPPDTPQSEPGAPVQEPERDEPPLRGSGPTS